MDGMTVFIGGPADGQWRRTNGDSVVRVSHMRACEITKLVSAYDPIPDIAESTLIHADYRLERIATRRVYVHQPMTIEQAVGRLLEFYSPPEEKS